MTAAPAVEVVAPDAVTALGEGPLWLPSGDLVWLDVVEPALLVLAQPGGAVRRTPLPRPPGAVVPLAGNAGRVLIALRHGLLLCDLADGALTELPLSGLDLEDRRFNDGRCDAAGRLWLGMMDRRLAAPIGGLACIGPRGTAREAAGDVTLSNGVAFSPDGRTLYLSDTRAGHVLAHDLDAVTGDVTRRRLLFELREGEARPDGCAVDAEGCLWIAAVNGGCLLRVDPAGRRVGEIRLPVSKPTSCAFGGEGMDMLFVTTARHGLDGDRLAAEPLAGQMLVIPRPGVRGMPEHGYRLEGS